jgi:hypothetical protein
MQQNNCSQPWKAYQGTEAPFAFPTPLGLALSQPSWCAFFILMLTPTKSTTHSVYGTHIHGKFMQVSRHLLSSQAEAVDQQACKMCVLATQQQGVGHTLLVTRTASAANPAAHIARNIFTWIDKMQGFALYVVQKDADGWVR